MFRHANCNYFDIFGQCEISFTIDNNLECPIYPDCVAIMLGYQKCSQYCESGYMIGKGRTEADEGCLNISDWNVLLDIINEYDSYNDLLPIEIVDEIHWEKNSQNEESQQKLSNNIHIKDLIGVIDYLENPFHDMNRLISCLKPGGYLILAYRNRFAISRYFRELAKFITRKIPIIKKLKPNSAFASDSPVKTLWLA